MTLTARTAETAKPREKNYKLSDGAGLYLRVYPSGRKEWRFRYKFKNAPKYSTSYLCYAR